MKKILSLFKKASLLTTVMTIAMVFLTAVLAKNAVFQFVAGHYISGGVSVLGTILILIIAICLISDLSRKQ